MERGYIFKHNTPIETHTKIMNLEYLTIYESFPSNFALEPLSVSIKQL